MKLDRRITGPVVEYCVAIQVLLRVGNKKLAIFNGDGTATLRLSHNRLLASLGVAQNCLASSCNSLPAGVARFISQLTASQQYNVQCGSVIFPVNVAAANCTEGQLIAPTHRAATVSIIFRVGPAKRPVRPTSWMTMRQSFSLARRHLPPTTMAFKVMYMAVSIHWRSVFRVLLSTFLPRSDQPLMRGRRHLIPLARKLSRSCLATAWR